MSGTQPVHTILGRVKEKLGASLRPSLRRRRPYHSDEERKLIAVANAALARMWGQVSFSLVYDWGYKTWKQLKEK